jgi:peptide/nickel transport system permease protein
MDSLAAPESVSRLRGLRRSPGAVAGMVIIVLMMVIAVAAPWVAPQDPLLQDLGGRLQPPSAAHLLGTDGLGRDLLSRLIYGSRPTLALVTLVAIFMVPIGLGVGIVSGYLAGPVDRVLTGLTNIVMAFPRLLLALAFVGLLGPGLLNVVLALALTGWPAYARLARTEALLLRNSDYLAAARMQGIVGIRLLWGHILPGCIPATLIRLALDLASVTLTGAALGFLGLGIPPPTAEWGVLVAEGGRVVFDQWWVAAAPGAAIFVTSVGFNLLAEGLRDLGDPRG